MTPYTKYTKGKKSEYKARDELIEQGYQVMQSSRSLGVFDIIAWNEFEVRWIQVKSCNKKKFYPEKIELEEIEKVKVPCGYDKELWVWIKRIGWRKWIFNPAKRTGKKGWLLAVGRDTVEKKLMPLNHLYPKPF